MSINFKDLMEASGALVKNFIGAAELRDLKTQARQLSGAFQPDIETVLQSIETKLNFFGYTLGALEDQEDEGDNGTEDLFILTNVDGEIARNAFIKLTWSKLASGQAAPMGQNRLGATALRLDVKVEVLEVSPEELQDMVDDVLVANQSGPLDYFNPDEGSEEEENIQESKKIPKKKISEDFKVGDKVEFTNAVKPKELKSGTIHKIENRPTHKFGKRVIHVKHHDTGESHIHLGSQLKKITPVQGRPHKETPKHKMSMRESVLNETVRVHTAIGRTQVIDSQGSPSLHVTVTSSGSLVLELGSEKFVVPNQKTEMVMQAIQDHLVKYAEHGHHTDEE